MLMTFHIRSFLPEAATAAHVRPWSQKPDFYVNGSGHGTVLAERRQR
jgi:hypothetical protein